jgi:hypothetical protein
VLLKAERYRELLDLETAPFVWCTYRRWGFRALVAQGKRADALRYAEASRSITGNSDVPIAHACEELLLQSGMADDLLDALGSRGPLFQGVCELLSAEHVGFDELWGTLSALARSLGSNTASVLSVLGELTDWSGVPSIALSVSSAEPAPAERLERSAAVAVTIVEVAPLLPVSICADASTWRAYERDGAESHAKDVLSAGLVVRASEPAENEQHEPLRQRARATLAEAKARPHDREADTRARSVVENLVYEALQTNPYTRDRFELNGTLDVFFGSRRLEVDLLDRAGGVALEIDGYYHFRDPEAYRRDRAKDRLMQRNGLLVVRALADDAVEALDELVARIVDLVLERRRLAGTEIHDD